MDRIRGIFRALLPLAPLLVTAAVFLPSLGGEFLNYDDINNYLRNDAYKGLGPGQLKWIFTSFLNGPYTPLAWLTSSLDFLVWGMDPFGHHLTSVLLHAANAALFFLLCRLVLRAAGAQEGPGLKAACLGGALLFSLHPLRVESASWLSGRHDLLSAFFFMAALGAYFRARRAGAKPQGLGGLWPALALYLCALLSKGTAVTLPLVLLLADVYPLGRLRLSPAPWRSPEVRGLLLEKVPFFALSAVFGAAAFAGQRSAQALAGLAEFGPGQRLAQFIYNLGFYPWKTLFPAGLLPYYRQPEGFGLLHGEALFFGAVALLLTAAAWRLRRTLPAAAATWAFYLLTVWPVSGLFKINAYLAADRYAYLPGLAFAALAAGGLYRAFSAGRRAAAAAGLAAAALAGALGAASVAQQEVWRTSYSLWSYAAGKDPGLGIAYCNLGELLIKEGRLAEAEKMYRRALALAAELPEEHRGTAALFGNTAAGKAPPPGGEPRRSQSAALVLNNVGLMLAEQGKFLEAEAQYRLALKADPALAQLHDNLGITLASRGRLKAAEHEHRQALRLEPRYAAGRYNLAHCLAGQGRLREAEAGYLEALRLDPGLAEASNNLGALLAARGRLGEAAARFSEAVRLKPDYAEAHYNLGTALHRQRDLRGAEAAYSRAVELQPDYAAAHYNLGMVLYQRGSLAEAMDHLKKAVSLDPALDPRRR